MADDETKQDAPQTTDEDADKDDVEGHKVIVSGQRPGEDGNPESTEEGRPTHQSESRPYR